MILDSRRSRLFAILPFALAIFTMGPASASAQDDNKPPQGFTALFNGRDFNNWTGSITKDPAEFAAMSDKERAEWDAKMKKGIQDHWRVVDGVLVTDGNPEFFLATPRDYGDFEMWVDWKLEKNGDSGIYLRGVPQVQIWDPTNAHEKHNGADKGSGGLWNNKKHERFPTEVADKPIGEWNRMYIRMVGPYVTVKLNGKKVVDNVILDNYYHPDAPVPMRGPIYLQTHTTKLYFRNIFVREIPADEANRDLAKIKGGQAGFKPIFNNKDLSGWTGTRRPIPSSTAPLSAQAARMATCLPTTRTTISSLGWNSSCRPPGTTASQFAPHDPGRYRL